MSPSNIPPYVNPLDPVSPFHPLNQPRPFALPRCPSVPLSSLSPQPISWLWPHRIPKKMVTLLAGDPGTGKSFLALDLAARCSAGLPFPNSAQPTTPSTVLLLAAEDDPTSSLIPRLTALTANLQNIHFLDPDPIHYQHQVINPPVTTCSTRTAVRTKKKWMDKGFAAMGWDGYDDALDDSVEHDRIARINAQRELRQALAPTLRRPFDLNDPQSLAALHTAIGQCEGPPPALLIIDPISAFVGSDISSRTARLALTNLTDFARAANLAVLAITHLSKNDRAKSIHRTAGALAWVTVSRVAYMLERPDNQSAATLTRIKSNIPIESAPLSFALPNPDPLPSAQPPTIPGQPIWSLAGATQPKANAAETFLLNILANGPLPMSEVHQAALGHAFSLGTLRRAKLSLDIESSRSQATTAVGSGPSPALPPRANPFPLRPNLATAIMPNNSNNCAAPHSTKPCAPSPFPQQLQAKINMRKHARPVRTFPPRAYLPIRSDRPLCPRTSTARMGEDEPGWMQDLPPKAIVHGESRKRIREDGARREERTYTGSRAAIGLVVRMFGIGHARCEPLEAD